MLYLCKLISTFHCDHLEKPTATSLSIDFTPLMARPIAKPRVKASSTKEKQGRPARDNSASKHAKKTWTSSLLSRFWPCLDSRQKISTITWFRSAPLHNLIFRFFYTSWFSPTFQFFLLGISQEVFSTKSPRSFGFPLPIPQKVGGFSLIDPPVFFHHLPLGFGKFFTYNYA